MSKKAAIKIFETNEVSQNMGQLKLLSETIEGTTNCSTLKLPKEEKSQLSPKLGQLKMLVTGIRKAS